MASYITQVPGKVYIQKMYNFRYIVQNIQWNTREVRIHLTSSTGTTKIEVHGIIIFNGWNHRSHKF